MNASIRDNRDIFLCMSDSEDGAGKELGENSNNILLSEKKIKVTETVDCRKRESCILRTVSDFENGLSEETRDDSVCIIDGPVKPLEKLEANDYVCAVNSAVKPYGRLKSNLQSSIDTDVLKINTDSKRILLSEKKTMETDRVDCRERKSCIFITVSDYENKAGEEARDDSVCIIDTPAKPWSKVNQDTKRSGWQKCTCGPIRKVQNNCNVSMLNNKGERGRKRKKNCKQSQQQNKKRRFADSLLSAASTGNSLLCTVADISMQSIHEKVSSPVQNVDSKENTICITSSDTEDIADKESHEYSSNVAKNSVKLKRKKSKGMKKWYGSKTWKRNNRKNMNATSKHAFTRHGNPGLCEVTNKKGGGQEIKLRPIVIDGSNVAIEHGKKSFSSEGIKIVVDYFLERGHTEVTAFVPQFRRNTYCRHSYPTVGQEILEDLASRRHVVFTPSRYVNGKRITPYDDRFILQLASMNGGIIVSNDNFRDLINENNLFKETIEKRLLMYCFAGDTFLPPTDPLGRYGPRLQKFLSFPKDEE